MLGQTLNLVTGPTVAAAIADPNNAINQLVSREADDRKLVEEIFMRILNRAPTEKELNKGMAALRAPTDAEQIRQQATQELATYEKALAERQAEWEKAKGLTPGKVSN